MYKTKKMVINNKYVYMYHYTLVLPQHYYVVDIFSAKTHEDCPMLHLAFCFQWTTNKQLWENERERERERERARVHMCVCLCVYMYKVKSKRRINFYPQQNFIFCKCHQTDYYFKHSVLFAWLLVTRPAQLSCQVLRTIPTILVFL